MAEDTTHVDLDTTNQEEDEQLEGELTAEIDKELEEAGDDPAKLKELLAKRDQTRKRLYERAKKAETEVKTFKQTNKGTPAKNTSKNTDNGTEFKGLDYAQKAYLMAQDIRGADEFSIIEEAMKASGRDLDAVLESNFVKSELKALREQKATEDASIKGGSSRGGNSSRNSVDYWIQKGELPPEDQVDLRRKVVNAKIALHKNKSKFAKN